MGRGRILVRDLRAMLEFLRANYALKGHERFIANAVHGLPRLVRSDLSAYCEIDPLQQASTNWLDRPEVNTPEAARIWESHMLEMPVLAHYLQTGDGRAFKVTDFVSQRRFRDTGVYTDHYRPKRIEYVLATWVPSPRVAIGIGLHRQTGDFTDDERLLLELLRPHLIQGWRNAQMVTRLEREARVARALAGLHSSVAVLDERGNASFVGDRARMLFASHFPAPDGPLPEPVGRWARALAAEYGRNVDEVPSRSAPLLHDADGRRLVVRPFFRATGMVLIVEERRRRDPQLLGSLGLTRRECEVLTWVAEGKTNGDIAAILGCAEKTVEKHLEHVYRKLDVPNRAAAVAAATLAAERAQA